MHTAHPSMRPGAIIGYRKNGTPIRLIAGGSETPPEPPTGDPVGQPDPQPPAPTPAPVPADPAQPPAPASADPAPPAKPSDPSSVDQLPAWAQRELREARSDAASNRAKAKENADAIEALKQQSQSQLDKIAQALGLKPEEATPEQIAAERDAARQRAEVADAKARATTVELAVFRAAAAAGADGNKLLDSRSFSDTLAGLDPAAGDFQAQVADKIAAAIEEHPDWSTTPPAAQQPAAGQPPAPQPVPEGRSGAPFTGAPQQPRQWTEADVAAASPEQVQKAMKEGLLQTLGFGTARKARR